MGAEVRRGNATVIPGQTVEINTDSKTGRVTEYLPDGSINVRQERPMGASPGPWLPEGTIEKATLDPHVAIVLADGEGGTWTIAALATLATNLFPRMASMLRELEWKGGDEPMCPSCGTVRRFAEQVNPVEYHYPDCRLSSLLAELPK